jgi:hypothetical protein
MAGVATSKWRESASISELSAKSELCTTPANLRWIFRASGADLTTDAMHSLP